MYLVYNNLKLDEVYIIIFIFKVNIIKYFIFLDMFEIELKL